MCMLDTISAKRDEIYAAANDAAVAFVAFCLESYKTRHALSGDESARIFCRYGVGDYLLDGYDILHSFGERQILDDIDRFIEVRATSESASMSPLHTSRPRDSSDSKEGAKTRLPA